MTENELPYTDQDFMLMSAMLSKCPHSTDISIHQTFVHT